MQDVKLIVGCGYLGQRVAQRWLSAGATVYAVTRAPKRAESWQRPGIRPIVADVTRPDSMSALPAAHTVLYSVGYDRSSGHGMRQVYVDGLRNTLEALPPSIGKLLYISSTGVYGQSGGVWVDEHSACQPARESGQVCLAAEDLLREHRLGERSVVLRLAGIYGPGRIPRADALRAGEPIAAPRDGYLNLIHVDDAASVVLAAEKLAVPPRLYTVSDGRPPVRHEYYAELARLLGAPPPQFVDPPADSPAALRAESNKRIGNQRMLDELRVELAYPGFREGLAAIVAASGESRPMG